MRLHKTAKRLDESKKALATIPFQFGQNKQQELLRLVFEVSQRENISPFVLVQQAARDNGFVAAQQTFTFLKQYLLARRYPNSFTKKNSHCFYLPKINFDNRCMVTEKRSLAFCPETIFIEQEAQKYPLTKTIVEQFPRAKKVSITTVAQYRESEKRTAAQRNGSLSNAKIRVPLQLFRVNPFPSSNAQETDVSLLKVAQPSTMSSRVSSQFIQQKIVVTARAYNERAKSLFLIKERYDFLKPCPCTQGAIHCGYHIVNLGFGCIYDCSYCFLQGYANSEGIVLPVNSSDFLKKIECTIRNKRGMLRMGTGEFGDSLALDDITGFGRMLIEFFSRLENASIELKTKSANVKGLLSLAHNRRSVIAWSLNPQSIIESDEWKTSSLQERLNAAKQCLDTDYLVAFHFDPIIYSEHWERQYQYLMEALFSAVKGKEKNIAWISLGTLRFNPRLKTVIEQRFPHTTLLNAELILEFDNKLRYSNHLRRTIYKKMYSWIRKHSRSINVYLCMEPTEMWKEALLRATFC